MPTAGVSRNIKGEDTALAAFNAAMKVLIGKTTSDVVYLYTEGEATCARVTLAEHKHNLTDVLHTWGCCSCSLSKQEQMCRHHVLVLLHIFPDVDSTTFSNQLMKFAGRKFGATGMCFPGVGGMQPLCDKLSALSQEMKAEHTSQQSTDPSLQPAFQPNASAPMIHQAHAIMAEYQKQQPATHSTAPPSNISCGVPPAQPLCNQKPCWRVRCSRSSIAHRTLPQPVHSTLNNATCRPTAPPAPSNLICGDQ
jgi:hypothetical protein